MGEDIFIDKASNKQFRRFKYFDHEVIQDVETGWINAGQFIGDTTEPGKKRRDFDKFRRSGDDYELCIDYLHEHYQMDGFPIYNRGYGSEVRGTYVPFPIFQVIALWADKKHKFSLLESLTYINDIANTKDISTYEELKQLNKQLKNKLEILEKEKLELTTPINPLISPSCIYAVPVNNDYFQLKYSSTKVSPKVNTLRMMEIVNAKIVLDETKKYLNEQGMVTIINGKKGINIKQID